jgi:hypothetical protein
MSGKDLIRVEALPGDTMSPDEPFVVKIARPHGDPPAYWIEDREGGVMLAYKMEDYPELTEHLPSPGTSYHNARFKPTGELVIDFTPLRGTEPW